MGAALKRKKMVFFPLIVEFLNVPCIFWITVFFWGEGEYLVSGMSFANVFSQSVVCLFILLTVSFTEEKM